MQNEKSSASAGWYLLGGLIVGAAAGVLLAPKSGLETREDIADWRERGRANVRAFLTRVAGTKGEAAKKAAAASRDEAKELVGA